MEEAEVKAGGPDKLKRAVAEGRVKKQMKDGVEFYLFPNMKAGQKHPSTQARRSRGRSASQMHNSKWCQT